MITLLFITTGCFKDNNMENITIYTTVYPVEYVVNRLYSEHSTIKSIYPNGTDINTYELTDTLLNEYSDTDMFIFNGLSNEQAYVKPMSNKNKDLKIIDVTNSMEYTYAMEELWIDPTNVLTIANSIKKGFNEYITSSYLEKEIEENYNLLKNDLANLDAKYRKAGTNASLPYIIVGNDSYLFLQKYGITVLSLENNDKLTDKTINDAKKLIAEGKIKYVYMLDSDAENENINKLIEGTEIEILTLYNVTNLTEETKKANDYLTLMNANLDALKEQLYD